MYGYSEKTQCSSCEHCKVCSFKEQFQKAQNAVDKVTVSLGDRSLKYLRDFDWIKKVELECTYFISAKFAARES
jgi:hypothetical protein